MVGLWSRVALEENSYIDEIIDYPDPWIQNKQPLGYLRLVGRLLRRRFNVAYVFHSHPLIHLIAVLARIPRRYGFFDPQLKKQGTLLTAKAEWEPNTDRYIADNYLDIPRLAGWQGFDLSLDFVLSEDDVKQTKSILDDHRLKEGEYVMIAPGGGINPRQNVFEKRWGNQKFADLCNLISDQWKLPIVLTGSPQEALIGEEIAAEPSEGLIDLIGKTSFRQTAGLIAQSKMLVSNDSSVMHLAVAFKTPSLAIFGPSNPKSLLPQSEINQWITSGLDCSPCYCNSIFEGCEHLNCMKQLTAEAVIERLNRMSELTS